MQINPLYKVDYKKTPRFTQKYSKIENSSIINIFAVLNKVDLTLRIMFLVLWATGMRVSEICTLKRGDIFKNEIGCFIKSYQQKMRKEVENPIPLALYELIDSLRQEKTNQLSDESGEYLFLTVKNNPYRSEHFRHSLRKIFLALGIQVEIGKDYIFNCHDYRHTYATNLAEKGYPDPIIQLLLHHKSIGMTGAYIERTEEQKKRKYFDFININGKIIKPESFCSSFDLDEDVSNINSNTQILPNGICSLPLKAGNCPHGPNACLVCKDFRTDRSYLHTHEVQLIRTKILLEAAKTNGWERQVETLEMFSENLENIISEINLLIKHGN